MVLLQFLGGALGFLAHICLVVLIIQCRKKGTDDNQNFPSWILAGTIDLMVAIATIKTEGNYYLPLFYFPGAVCVAIALFFKKQNKWEKWDWVVVTLAGICFTAVWKQEDTTAIIIGAGASVVSFIPQIKDIAKSKNGVHWLMWLSYSIFVIGDILSIAGGNDNSTKERAYACAELMLSTIMLSMFLYNFLYKNKKKKPKKNIG